MDSLCEVMLPCCCPDDDADEGEPSDDNEDDDFPSQPLPSHEDVKAAQPLLHHDVKLAQSLRHDVKLAQSQCHDVKLAQSLRHDVKFTQPQPRHSENHAKSQSQPCQDDAHASLPNLDDCPPQPLLTVLHAAGGALLGHHAAVACLLVLLALTVLWAASVGVHGSEDKTDVVPSPDDLLAALASVGVARTVDHNRSGLSCLQCVLLAKLASVGDVYLD